MGMWRFAGQADLAPMPLDQNPAVSMVPPSMCHPVGMVPWRPFPPSRAPDVGVAIPTMVPGDPNIFTAGRRPPPFDYSMGWPDANHNIARRSAEGQRARKNQSDQSRQNHSTLFLLLKPANEFQHQVRLPSSPPPKGVVENQQNYGAENRHE
jgi:hypothetical protein